MNRYRIKDIGQTVSGKKSADDGVTLKSSKFQIGDFMDIAIRVRACCLILALNCSLLQEPRAMRDDRRGDRRNFRNYWRKTKISGRVFYQKNTEARIFDCPCNFRKFLHFVSSIDIVFRQKIIIENYLNNYRHRLDSKMLDESEEDRTPLIQDVTESGNGTKRTDKVLLLKCFVAVLTCYLLYAICDESIFKQVIQLN